MHQLGTVLLIFFLNARWDFQCLLRRCSGDKRSETSSHLHAVSVELGSLHKPLGSCSLTRLLTRFLILAPQIALKILLVSHLHANLLCIGFCFVAPRRSVRGVQLVTLLSVYLLCLEQEKIN